MLITYQLKDEKHSIAERKLKLQVYKAEKEKKLLNEQLTSLVNNNNTHSNSSLNNKPPKTKSQRVVTLSSARKTVKPVSTSSTPTKHKSISLRMNNSAQHYSSKTKKTIEENITHKRNSSIVINKSKARNYFEQLDNSSMKIITIDKKEEKNKKNVNTNLRASHKKSNSTFISPNPSIKKDKKNNNANNKVSRNAKNTNHHNHNNPHAHNSNNVIINNYNYINVYTTSGISESEVKNVVKKRISNNHKHSNSNTINTNNNTNSHNHKPPIASNKKKK
jgi:hypothetical protein